MFVSCARRSGHKKQNRQMASEKREIVSRLSNDDVSVHEDLRIEYGDDDEVLDGKTIFRKYGNAVFMVFTTDGTNTYQGSGFLLILMAWRSVIIMCSKELLLEQSK